MAKYTASTSVSKAPNYVYVQVRELCTFWICGPRLLNVATGGVWDPFVLLPKILGCWVFFARAFLLGRLVLLEPWINIILHTTRGRGIFKNYKIGKEQATSENREQCTRIQKITAKRSDPEKNPKRYPEQKRGKEPLTEERRNYRSLF